MRNTYPVESWKCTWEGRRGIKPLTLHHTFYKYPAEPFLIDLTLRKHDYRVVRLIPHGSLVRGDDRFDLGTFLNIAGIPYSQYAYMYLQTRRGPVYICHPFQYSANSVGLGQKLYNVTTSPDGEKCHIILGHTHQPQKGRSPDGLRSIHALGCMRDPLKTKYIQTNATTHHQWGRGFCMIRNGFIHDLSLEDTDWQFLLGEYCPPQLRGAA